MDGGELGVTLSYLDWVITSKLALPSEGDGGTTASVRKGCCGWHYFSRSDLYIKIIKEFFCTVQYIGIGCFTHVLRFVFRGRRVIISAQAGGIFRHP